MSLNRIALTLSTLALFCLAGCRGHENIAAKRNSSNSTATTPTATAAPPPVAAAPVAAKTSGVASVEASSAPAAKSTSVKKAAPEAYTPNQTQWLDFPKLPGVKYAVYDGDPTLNSIYTMRLRFPDGYKIPPHFHPRIERITVISGTLNVGSGDVFNQNATVAVPAGGFIAMGADMHYYCWTRGDTIIQLTGIGPWEIRYVNPKDVPALKRN